MRTFLLLLTLVDVTYIAVNRNRLYLRDPLGTVYRDEVKQPGTRVFINYSNDILVQTGDGPHMEQYLVQTWNGIPGVPAELKCLGGLACLTSEDHAPATPIPGDSKAQMTSRRVGFTHNSKVHVRITLW